MAKYQLLSNGVYDSERGASIPEELANVDWVEYLQWVDDGGVPDPMDVYIPEWNDDGRTLRDDLLTACDWTQLSDSPLDAPTKALWVTYRQELRDLPATYTDYSTVVWPTPPAE